ncbi:hypothetical protein BBO99_00007978 [Phytophthora kernoviae]|uniref:Uncharacterized protein n=2 Tax=Phytophthora kernoviae TaxID=325452 RepID=A0A421F1D2_9STRA|nr:hypothetical protein G195_006069 [Phytophthora kernoviae 00238/432]KAG2526520.1 hypothetical protein JM18_004358 [Phytophthora kernoviae]KAG2530545.1 hypothetical protein JM16_000857 [Phytophthora kernoviae]RLN14737.1 hypothetical protein BBI17_007929 [Phytophthora kernoviae]RLN75885.1 hypothetical protein BBO99_00007978 [Phytophthora kernoviae]
MPMVAINSSSPVSASKSKSGSMSPTAKGIWSLDEHDRFLEAMKLYPKGPWKSIADHIATRSVRQVQTHAQKYQEKVSRRLRGLRKSKKKLVRPEHRIDEDTMELCKLVDCAAEKLVAASRKSSSRCGGVKLEPLQKKSVVKQEPSEAHSSPRGTDVEMKTEDSFLPLPFLDFGEDIDLDPVHIPTMSQCNFPSTLELAVLAHVRVTITGVLCTSATTVKATQRIETTQDKVVDLQASDYM